MIDEKFMYEKIQIGSDNDKVIAYLYGKDNKFYYKHTSESTYSEPFESLLDLIFSVDEKYFKLIK